MSFDGDEGEKSSPIDGLQHISLSGSRRLIGNDWSPAGRFLGGPIETENDPVNVRGVENAADILKTADGTYAPEIVQAENEDEGVYQTLLVFVNVDNPDDFVAVCPTRTEES